jgi:hypothetical protein
MSTHVTQNGCDAVETGATSRRASSSAVEPRQIATAPMLLRGRRGTCSIVRKKTENYFMDDFSAAEARFRIFAIGEYRIASAENRL